MKKVEDLERQLAAKQQAPALAVLPDTKVMSV